jgi:hypothetical protein
MPRYRVFLTAGFEADDAGDAHDVVRNITSDLFGHPNVYEVEGEMEEVNVRQTPDPVVCEHYDLGPPDDQGVQICNGCGQMILQTISGMTPDEFEGQRSTFTAREGADLPPPEEM